MPLSYLWTAPPPHLALTSLPCDSPRWPVSQELGKGERKRRLLWGAQCYLTHTLSGPCPVSFSTPPNPQPPTKLAPKCGPLLCVCVVYSRLEGRCREGGGRRRQGIHHCNLYKADLAGRPAGLGDMKGSRVGWDPEHTHLDGKDTFNQARLKVLMTWITTMVWSFT